MELQSRLQHSKEPKCSEKNNKGSSLVLVISVMAIIGIMAIVLLSVSLVNFRMKHVNLQAQENFYDAESVLDEIRSGLAVDVSKSVGAAYQTTLENYSENYESLRKSLYFTTFQNTLLGTDIGLRDTTSGTTQMKYNIDHLKSFVNAQKLADTNISVVNGALPLIEVNAEEGTVTLKNLYISYTDDRNYMTQIKTDIVLSCPQIDLSQETTSPTDLLSYCIVANDMTKTSGGVVNLKGNAYVGYDGTDFTTTNVTFAPVDGSTPASLITGGELLARVGSNVTINNMNTWAHEIYVDSAAVSVTGTSKTYLNDDLVMENQLQSVDKPSVTLNGEVYAYGSPDTASLADVYQDDAGNMKTSASNPSLYSSAFLINCKNATLDMSGVSKLMIAGNSYISADVEDSNNTNILMGDSVALKSDQRAYLVPTQYVASGCLGGKKNPISEAEYQTLLTQVQTKIKDETGVEVTGEDPSLFWCDQNGSTDIPEALKNLGVTGIAREVYRVQVGSTTMNMVYFFLEFDSEKSATEYGKSYHDADSNLQYRVDNSHYNTRILYPTNMNTNTGEGNKEADDYTFYYNGSVLIPEGTDTKFLTGSCTTLDSGLQNKLMQNQILYQDQYAGLRHKLIDNYASLSTKEKTQRVYENLVLKMESSDYKYNIPAGLSKSFVTADGSGAAIVVNGDYVLSNASGSDVAKVEDPSGNSVELHLVIASGNVTVKTTNFNGLIISGGDIVFAPGIASNVTADREKVEAVMGARDANGVRPADYMINGNYYVSSTGGGEAPSTGGATTVDYVDCVGYSNWKKY